MQVVVPADKAAPLRAMRPFFEREIFGHIALFFDGQNAEQLRTAVPGAELRTPSIADLFVAKMQGTSA